ncbi:4069_t:CDS:2 [Paraglomus occultum]|uniref:tRNA-splicing endonuclease subunit Sen34 n=1 Tax=Paraglomus occultum TaxID=144539 RepID=A0A9N9ACJ1_9GLOM|nr:4069_t:CDS:2 [Paraglomus occultum]
MSLKNPFKVHIVDNKALVYDADAIHTLRSQYHIVGSLIGTLPQLPMQNRFYGLPLKLMQEEVTLLLSKGVITLIEDRSAHRCPTDDEIDAYHKEKADDETRQIADYLRTRKARIANHTSGVNKLNEDDNSLGSHKIQGVDQSPTISPLSSPSPSPLSESQQEVTITNDIPKLEPPRGFSPSVTTKTSSYLFPWYDDKNCSHASLEEARSQLIWTWPESDEDKTRYKVFKDIWEKGYYITSGSKFGSDYLAYPGDPLQYHSQFAVSVVDMDAPINPIDIIREGRMSTVVRKTKLFCSWDKDKDEVVYVSIQWAGK